jgi:hypothetical protein
MASKKIKAPEGTDEADTDVETFSVGEPKPMETIEVTLRGVVPMLMHNGQLADPLNEFAKALKEITQIKNKTDEHHYEIARLEFLGGLWLQGGRLAIPSMALEACFKEGARLRRLGRNADAGAFVQEDAPVTYDGPSKPDDLWKDRARFALSVGARNKGTGGRVQRTRCIIREWEVSFVQHYDTELFNRATIELVWKDAGSRKGIGDWRPKFGRYTATFQQ